MGRARLNRRVSARLAPTAHRHRLQRKQREATVADQFPRSKYPAKSRIAIIAAILVAGSSAFWPSIPDALMGPPIDVRVELGTVDGGHKFSPNVLNFEKGKLYNLVLSNPSRETHYFSSPHLAASVDTRKVVSRNGSGLAAEVKGVIREIEVFPGGSAEWWFVPILRGNFEDLHCHNENERGQKHAELGMTAKITIR